MTRQEQAAHELSLQQKLIARLDEENQFVTLEDGFVHYWPRFGAGALDANSLRMIAEELDRRNAAMVAATDEYFAKEREDGLATDN